MSKPNKSPVNLLATVTPPPNPVVGDTYLNPTDKKIYAYDGSVWNAGTGATVDTHSHSVADLPAAMATDAEVTTAISTHTSAASHPALSTAAPAALGAASAGSGTTAAKADHVHPTTGLSLAHAHDYLPLTGGGLTGALQINTSKGLTLHSPGASVVSIASFNYSGYYGLRIINDWQGDSGGLAPLQIAGPIDGNSATTVDWVRGDRAAASHGTHVNGVTTAVVTTDGAGNVYFGYGGTGMPVCSNGDWGAMNRAPHIGSWGGGAITVMNLNASAICRLNVIGA